jgi:hypothetical protein
MTEPEPIVAERLRMLSEIDDTKLAFIEQDIVRALRERPMRTWCDGCDRMLSALWRKAQTNAKEM